MKFSVLISFLLVSVFAIGDDLAARVDAGWAQAMTTWNPRTGVVTGCDSRKSLPPPDATNNLYRMYKGRSGGWGPPGVGKTTLANVVANATKAEFVTYSAVTSGIKEIKEIMARAEQGRLLGIRTVLFVDEIHRFNKAQQDAFLPFVEQGSIILIGATTENPSFEVNSALLSRCKVFVLKGLTEENLVALLRHALDEDRGFGKLGVVCSDDMLRKIAIFANGDARNALGTLETAVANSTINQDGKPEITEDVLSQVVNRKALMYDKNGEEHYNIISALHKSMRNSDPDAAVYWLARMLEGGEDPLYIARRCIRFASEDVGLADPNALLLADAVWNACHNLGVPSATCT